MIYSLMDELKKDFWVSQENIIYINKELYEFRHIMTYEDLLEYIYAIWWEEKKHIFIDEVQDIQQFEKALRDLQARWHDIYISGSNAHMLSSEIATYLTWRYIECEIYPLTYSEFLSFHEKETGTKSFKDFMIYGWLPYLMNLPLEENIVFDYLKSVYNTILLKDIIWRYNIRNTTFMENLMIFLSDNTWSLFTANNISAYLKSQRIKISTNVIIEYIKYACDVFLIHKVSRYDIIGKKIFAVNDKFYFSDIWIRNILVGGYKQQDISKILENIVYSHFKAHSYTITVWKLREKEIDFIVEKNWKKKYIQVSYLMQSEETRKRECDNLLAISDNYEKIVLSMDDFAWWNNEGIYHYNIIDYLATFQDT